MFSSASRNSRTLTGTSSDNLFFYLGLLSRIFIIHTTAKERRGYLSNSSLPLPPISQALKTSAGQLLPRVHLCGELTPGLEPGTLGFRAQIANH